MPHCGTIEHTFSNSIPLVCGTHWVKQFLPHTSHGEGPICIWGNWIHQALSTNQATVLVMVMLYCYCLQLHCATIIDKVQGDIEVVADKCKEILLSKDSNLAGEDGLLAPIAGFVAIGEVPGLACFTPNICTTAKKNSVAKYVRILQEIASNVAKELKYRGYLNDLSVHTMRHEQQRRPCTQESVGR